MSNRLKTATTIVLNMLKGGLIVGTGYAAISYFDLPATTLLLVAMIVGYAILDMRIDDLSAEVDYLRSQLPEHDFDPMEGWPPVD